MAGRSTGLYATAQILQKGETNMRISPWTFQWSSFFGIRHGTVFGLLNMEAQTFQV